MLESSLVVFSQGLLRDPHHLPGTCWRPPQPQAAHQDGSGPAASAPPHSQCYPWCSTVQHKCTVLLYFCVYREFTLYILCCIYFRHSYIMYMCISYICVELILHSGDHRKNTWIWSLTINLWWTIVNRQGYKSINVTISTVSWLLFSLLSWFVIVCPRQWLQVISDIQYDSIASV